MWIRHHGEFIWKGTIRHPWKLYCSKKTTFFLAISMIVLKVPSKNRLIGKNFGGWPGLTKPYLPAVPLTFNILSTFWGWSRQNLTNFSHWVRRENLEHWNKLKLIFPVLINLMRTKWWWIWIQKRILKLLKLKNWATILLLFVKKISLLFIIGVFISSLIGFHLINFHWYKKSQFQIPFQSAPTLTARNHEYPSVSAKPFTQFNWGRSSLAPLC